MVNDALYKVQSTKFEVKNILGTLYFVLGTSHKLLHYYSSNMRPALVADWLPTFAGAEHVIAELSELWPDAPIYTTVARRRKLGPLKKAKIKTSKLQKWYWFFRKHQPLLPWMPCAIERMNLDGYDLIFSSSHAIGKGVIPPSKAVHICYCHTPMRYAWEMEKEYLEDFNVPGYMRSYIKKKLKELRRWDLSTAKRVDVFLANSTTVQERIKRIYGRDSKVIHPPVSDRFFPTPLNESSDKKYFLAIGRFVPYKRFDLLIEAANEYRLPLKIAGTGQDENRLKKLAGPTVEFLGFVPSEDLPKLYRDAKALLFPQFEDAGVVPLEAQACGTPVVAFKQGGVLDTVDEKVSGVFFEKQSIESLHDAIERFEERKFDSKAIREHARKFCSHRFKEKIKDVVKATV